MRVSACLIVRDEERFIGSCLERLTPFVDEVVVVDTGSHDRTAEICREAGAKVVHHPWQDDFAAARNVALDHASGDFILYLDADEWLDEATAGVLRRLPNLDAFYVTVVNYADLAAENVIERFQAIRIFRRHPEIRFEGRVHEQVIPSLTRLGARLGHLPLRLNHFGYVPEVVAAKGKAGRNLRLFQLEEDDTPSARFHLARELMVTGAWEEAESRLSALLQDPEVMPASPVSLYARLSLCDCLVSLRDFPRLLEVASTAIGLFPGQGEFYYHKALAEANMGDAPSAVRDLLWVLSEPDGQEKLWARGTLKGDGWTLLGQLLLGLGRADAALEAAVNGLRAGNTTAVSLFAELTLDRVGVAGVLAALETLPARPAQQRALQEAFLARHLYAAAARVPEPLPEAYEVRRLVAEGRLAEARERIAAAPPVDPLDQLAASVLRAAAGEPGLDPVALYLVDDAAPRPFLAVPEVRFVGLLLAQMGAVELLVRLLVREQGPERGPREAISLLKKVALPLKEAS